MVEFSIVVPVYQAKKYLKRLVKSVLEQDYKKYELLLVDDGSSDGSETICDIFSAQYTQIKTIHKKNGGVSSARNEGIRSAKGRYLVFLDADDYIDGGFLSDAAAIIEKNAPDVLVYGYCLEKSNATENYLLPLAGNYTQKTLLDKFATFAKDSSFNSVCNKIFCMDIIQREKLEFPQQKIAEDGIFVCRFLRNASTFYFSNKSYYHYCQNAGSAVHKFCESRWKDENNYLKEMQKCAQHLAPMHVSRIMGIKYRNAILFDLYNLLESKDSTMLCARTLKKHLSTIYDLIDWNLETQDKMLKLQLQLLRKYHTLELIALMRFKKKIKRLGQ